MRGRKLLVGLLITGILLNCNVSNSAASNNSEKSEIQNVSNFDNGIVINDSGVVKPLKSSNKFPSRYDPRKNNMVSAVRDQGTNGTCWGFATVAAMESNLIKKGITKKNVDLSENQLMYFFYNRCADNIGYTRGDKNVALANSWIDNGGSSTLLGFSAMTWAGATKESVSKYRTTPSKKLANRHEYVLKNFYMYNYSVDKIKEVIMDKGAVTIGMYYDTLYVDEDTGATYCNNALGIVNHEVAIVGWDDNYSCDNYKYASPGLNGAWIAKNSYGKSSGDNGYLYISYYDKSLSSANAFDMVRKSAFYDNNYQYDGTASDIYYNLSKGDVIANAFNAKATPNHKEKIRAIGLCTYTTNTKYKLQIYKNVKKYSNPESGTKVLKKAKTGCIKDAGYVTIPINSNVNLKYGERFSVVITLKSDARIGADSSSEYSWLRFQSNVGKNQSYINRGSGWKDFGNMCKSNFRIKVYTDTL